MARERLWHFALRVYAMPGIEEDCLAFQDRHGGDVPILLFTLWAGAAGCSLREDDVRSVLDSLASWRDDVIAPLRTLRVRMRDRGSIPAALVDDAVTIRRAVKALELRAERRELEWLEGWLPRQRESGTAAAANNLTVYLGVLGHSRESFGAARCDRILRAAHAPKETHGF